MAEQNTDRISKYLTPRLQDMVFNELSPDYLARSGAEEMLGGVPVPVGYEGSEASVTIDISFYSLALFVWECPCGPPLGSYHKVSTHCPECFFMRLCVTNNSNRPLTKIDNL